MELLTGLLADLAKTLLERGDIVCEEVSTKLTAPRFHTSSDIHFGTTHTHHTPHTHNSWKSTSEWTEAGKRILGERIDRVVITLEPTPAAWSLKLIDRTLVRVFLSLSLSSTWLLTCC